jgi:glucose-inhibited division protein A
LLSLVKILCKNEIFCNIIFTENLQLRLFIHLIQGFSTGLPERLQLPLVRTLPGLENCVMLRPAYAVEYDYLPAYQCSRSLMTKKFEGLFFSGQINGTTGYEEAAAQVCSFVFISLSQGIWLTEPDFFGS